VTAARIGRLGLAVLVTCAVAAALYWFVLRDDAPPPGGTRVELDVSRLENGPAPTHFDTGQQAVISSLPDDPGATLVVDDHKLTFAPRKPGESAAFYGSPDMEGPITRLGLRWVFQPRADLSAGAVSLVVAHGSEGTPPALLPPFPLQLVLTPINWNLSVKKDNATPPEPIAVGNFDPPLAADGTTSFEASVSIDGSVVTLDLPRRTKRVLNDARVAQWEGNYAAFGLYVNNALSDSIGGLEKMWATSRKGDA
jgi:hypothetical protein